MCSRSTTNTQCKPLSGSQSGLESGNASSTTSPQRRPYIAEEFHRATGLRLNDLPEFTLWIKRGSYFHGLLVERGQIQEFPNLIGAPLPRWPQPKPSKSRKESYRRAKGQRPCGRLKWAYYWDNCHSSTGDSCQGAPHAGGSCHWIGWYRPSACF